MTENHAFPVMEHFYTIQGEGCFSGYAAYFIRLGGCDVGCHWCDVKESWDADNHPKTSIDTLLSVVKSTSVDKVVITGGEPLMYDLKPLTDLFLGNKIRTHVETAGVYPITGNWDWICFSPKKFKKPLEEYYEQSHELKVVIFTKKDFEWAEEHAAKMNKNATLFLQTEWSKSEELLPLIIEYVKENPKWRISLQTHKYMNIP